MINGWAPGKVGIAVALLCEQAQTTERVEDRELTGDEWAELYTAVCEAVQEYMKPDDKSRILIGYLDG